MIDAAICVPAEFCQLQRRPCQDYSPTGHAQRSYRVAMRIKPTTAPLVGSRVRWRAYILACGAWAARLAMAEGENMNMGSWKKYPVVGVLVIFFSGRSINNSRKPCEPCSLWGSRLSLRPFAMREGAALWPPPPPPGKTCQMSI